jgi:hypothetical protein
MKVLAINGVGNELALVRRALERRRWTLHRLDTARFPPCGMSMSPGERVGHLALPGGCLRLRDVAAVWCRGDCAALEFPEEMEPETRRLCLEATRVSVEGLRSALPVFWLDDPFKVKVVDNKPMQLAAARDLGLDVPRTLVTNRPSDVRAFARSCGGTIVMKMVTRTGWMRKGGEDHRIYTNVLGKAELAALDGLELGAMIFRSVSRRPASSVLPRSAAGSSPPRSIRRRTQVPRSIGGANKKRSPRRGSRILCRVPLESGSSRSRTTSAWGMLRSI